VLESKTPEGLLKVFFKEQKEEYRVQSRDQGTPGSGNAATALYCSSKDCGLMLPGGVAYAECYYCRGDAPEPRDGEPVPAMELGPPGCERGLAFGMEPETEEVLERLCGGCVNCCCCCCCC
jgi:hypothetical protein